MKGKRGNPGKKRGTRGKLLKRQDLDHVHVEDTFQFQLPSHVAVSSDEDRKVGEGCYVSTTVHNRRYYGVLIDQESLRAASMLYFQDEAAGLELNRKMEQLYRLKAPNDVANPPTNKKRTVDDAGIMDDSNSSTKRMRQNVVPDDPLSSGPLDWMKPIKQNIHQKLDSTRTVQKFRYMSPTINSNEGKGTSMAGYRQLIATYVDVTAAAEDDPDRQQLIENACRSGGNFVGEYYYQYEVRGCTMCLMYHFYCDVLNIHVLFFVGNSERTLRCKSQMQQRVMNISIHCEHRWDSNLFYNSRLCPIGFHYLT
jgi:hypothetical protein